PWATRPLYPAEAVLGRAPQGAPAGRCSAAPCGRGPLSGVGFGAPLISGPSMLAFICPGCRAPLTAPDELAGKVVSCGRRHCTTTAPSAPSAPHAGRFGVLFRSLGSALCAKGLKALAGAVPFGEALYEIAEETWKQYRERRQEEALRADLEAAVQATPF